jgi:two-component system chemotaxis response regulator CheB
VDDSAIVRKILTECLVGEADIEVVGTAPDPYIAREKIDRLQPDVLTLDIEMPRMDGLTFLKELMSSRPMPVIVISSLAANGCAAALEAVERGAIEVLAKPNGPYSVTDLRFILPQKVRSAAKARLRVRQEAPGPPVVARVTPAVVDSSRCVIAIGASTGGTEAIRAVLEQLPQNMPPIVIVQHIPPVFSRAFADRLDKTCKMQVKEAADGDRVLPGVALIAPGDYHMLLRGRAGSYSVELKTGPRVCYQRPSVDVLFQSVADAGSATVAVLLTGMGSDGAQGMLAIRQRGGRTIAQDEETSVVYGMPKEAARIGAAERVLALQDIPGGICASIETIAGKLTSKAPEVGLRGM